MTRTIKNAASLLLSASLLLGGCLLLSAMALAGCASEVGAEPEGSASFLSWEDFRAQAELRADGVFVIDGDLPVEDEAELREIYDLRLEAHLAGLEGGEIADQEELLLRRGADAAWSAEEASDLRYCVQRFGGEETASSYEDLLRRIDRAELIAAIEGAAADWERVADVHFRRVERCEEALFVVEPAEEGASYIASAFFPGYPAAKRTLSVHRDWLSTGARSPELAPWSLRGLMRHQLGHALGFRHVHSGQQSCGPEEEEGSSSVMRYSDCAGTDGEDLGISEEDAVEAASLYGVPIPG